MDLLLIFELVYVLSAVIAAVGVPLYLANESRGATCDWQKPVKYFISYGHIIKGLVLAPIPVVNTIVSIYIICAQLDDVKVIKERKWYENR